MNPHDDLKRSLATGNVCAFVGAGLSVGAGLPGWYDLIADFAARIGYDLPPSRWATSETLIAAAQAYVNRKGLHSLISYLKDRLDTTGKQPTAAHRALARLPISLVFTANFDDLLEHAFRDAGRRVEVVVKDTAIPFMRHDPDSVNIVKLYGALDQPDTIVLARQQYDVFFLQRPQMVKLLEIELARSDTLYLGWSGTDPYFQMIFGELQAYFRQMMRPGYAVMFDVTDAQRAELARRHIRLVDLPSGDRTAQLAAWLDTLAPAPAGTTASLPAATGTSGITQTRSPRPAPTAAGGQTTTVTWNHAVTRELLNDALSDEELTTLCFDHFPTVYNQLSSGMPKGDKLLLLLDHCLRHEQMDVLLGAVRQANPAQYRKYEGLLRN